MKIRSLSSLLLLALCAGQIVAGEAIDTMYNYVKTIKKETIIKCAAFHALVHLIYKSRGPRTDEKGNWLINGETITPEERYRRAVATTAHSLIFELPSYLFDITFGTESDWKDKSVEESKPKDASTTINTTVVKKQCYATGSGVYCWYADNILRHINDVTKAGLSLLSIIVVIKDYAEKAHK